MNNNALITRKKLGILSLLIICLITVAFFYSTRSLSTSDNYSQTELQQLHHSLIAKEDSVHTQWLKTLNRLVKKTEGDLVWNTSSQQGVMKFVNLPITSKQQVYHLWIYDLKRSQDDPISGGYFSVTKNENIESFIPMQLADKAIQPYKFMIILESKNDYKKPQTLLLAQP